VFYVDKGYANISAKGAITGGTQYSSGPIFALGDAQFKLEAGNGIEVGAILNPFILTEPKFLYKPSYFTTYSGNSGIKLQSLAGDIRFNNDTTLIEAQAKRFTSANPQGEAYLIAGDIDNLMSLYPGNLTAYALTGGLQIANSLTLYPAVGSSFDLKAAGDINIGSKDQAVTVNQLDVNPSQLPSPLLPTTSTTGVIKYLLTTPQGGDITTVHAAQPVHQTDTTRNQIVSDHGSILGISTAVIVAAKATEISAGLDMINLGLQIQNLNSADVTSISAGRDIIYPLQRDPTNGAVQGSAGGIQLAGPGLLNVWAGRNIDLAASEGITTVGALLNSNLPNNGADIMVLAGNRLTKDTRPLDDFLQYYVINGAYQSSLAALSQQSSTSGRLQIALGVLFDEIRARPLKSRLFHKVRLNRRPINAVMTQ
jgi:filamentous hemagglutinin